MLKSLSTKAMVAAGVATVAMTAVSAPAEAITLYSDRAAWEAAITGANPIVTETYDTDVAFTSPFSTTTGSGITVSTNVGGIQSGKFGAGLGLFGQATFGLPGASVAFGTDLNDLSASFIQWEFLNAVGNVFAQGSFDSAQVSFFGAVQDPGDALISSVRFTRLGNPARIDFDNTSFATPVPTPALLPGLIGMGVAALRKRKGEAAADAEA